MERSENREYREERSSHFCKRSIMNRELTERERELIEMTRPATFYEMVAEVRESLPPTRYTRTQYMRACQGLF